jgi:sphingomyelin phosphodiesterase acid-like 3
MLRFAATIALLASVLAGGTSVSAQQPPEHWFLVSDIHFNPFTDRKLVERLAEAPADRWRAIFQSASPMPFASYGSDTNYSLLESTLDAMHARAGDAAVVIVTGDFLAHKFRAQFDRTARRHTDEAYDDFVDKTIAFLADEFRAAFPRARLIPVVGNNDGYCGDYQSTPHSVFLTRLAVEWGGSVGAPDPNAFVEQFGIGGYYTVPLPADGADAVVLNDVLWSTRYTNACGDPHSDPGGDELAWFQQTLRSETTHPVWVIMHIPPGVDVFSSLKEANDRPQMMLAGRFNDGFLSAIDSAFAVVMTLAGHTHMNGFRVIGPNAAEPLAPMIVVPSISPIFGNNPSFSILTVDTASARVHDDDVFVLYNLAVMARDPKRRAMWGREYDFNSVFGSGPIDAKHLASVQQMMFEDGPVRRRYEEFSDGESGRAPITDASWRVHWCANVALTQASFTACAMPQVQRSLPAQPSPPSTPSPSPALAPASTP